MMALAEEQIKTAFEQAEKEVTDLHSRIRQGIREAKETELESVFLKELRSQPKNPCNAKLLLKSIPKTLVAR